MENYGVPYMGSKSRIAPNIIQFLPKGERFVDLFGGGFAMTHCAILSGKYKRFLYNDFNPLIVELVRGGYQGKYNYKVFKPEFITREEFEKKKDKDGYIKYIWSFGNNGTGYMFGDDKEKWKHKLHDLVVFNKQDEELETLCQGINRACKSNDITERRKELSQFIENAIKHGKTKLKPFRKHTVAQQLQRLEHLQGLESLKEKELTEGRNIAIERLERVQQLEQLNRLERVQQLEQLNRLERVQQLEFTTGSYQDYKYQKGDIVYLDPPYENTAQYSKDTFDSKGFYDWVASRKYQIWFSSYKISDKRFKLVWAKQLRGILSKDGKALYNFECIYTNK